MYICLDNNQYLCFVLYFPIEAEREDAWVLHHPVRLAEFSVNIFLQCMNFFLCDFHLCLLQNRSMNVHVHGQSVLYLCSCTLLPWELKGRMLEYFIVRSGWWSFPSTFFTLYEFLFFVISISVCCKTEVWMYICIDNQYYVAALSFLIEAEREDAWVLCHRVRLAEFYGNFIYRVWIFILCDFHLCLLQNWSMNVHLHRQWVLCCCTLPPWRLKGRMLEYCVIRSGWRSFPSTFFTVNEFLFFVISISVCCKTEVWMYICIGNQYYVAVLYLPGGWKGEWCSQPLVCFTSGKIASHMHHPL